MSVVILIDDVTSLEHEMNVPMKAYHTLIAQTSQPDWSSLSKQERWLDARAMHWRILADNPKGDKNFAVLAYVQLKIICAFIEFPQSTISVVFEFTFHL